MDASDDEIGVDDLLGFGGAGANAAKRSLAFNAGKYDEAVRSIAALGHDPVKRDGKVTARAADDDAARARRAKAVEDEYERARNAVTRVTPQKVVGRMLGDDDDASTASSEVSLHEDVLSDDDEAPKLLSLEELRARKTDVETLPAVRRIAAMRRKAAPDDKYSVDYSRFAAIDSSDGEDEPTRADAYRSMDFKNLPKAATRRPAKKGSRASSTCATSSRPSRRRPTPSGATACTSRRRTVRALRERICRAARAPGPMRRSSARSSMRTKPK